MTDNKEILQNEKVKIITPQAYMEDFFERTRYYMDEKDTDVITPVRFGEMFGAIDVFFQFGQISREEYSNYSKRIYDMFFEVFPITKKK